MEITIQKVLQKVTLNLFLYMKIHVVVIVPYKSVTVIDVSVKDRFFQYSMPQLHVSSVIILNKYEFLHSKYLSPDQFIEEYK